MYYVVNLETRAILTYPDGSLIQWGDVESAANAARYAENLSDFPHSVLPVDAPVMVRLSDRRAVAPWC